MREEVREGKSKKGALKMSRATLIATLMAVVSAFISPAKAQTPLKTQPSAKSDQPTYVITAHTVVHDDSTNSQLDNYVFVYESEILKVQYAESQTSTVKPGTELGQVAQNLHWHTRYGRWPQEPDVSQVPHIGVPIRACEMDKDPDSDGRPVIAIQSVSAPCMCQIGDMLHYVLAPNGGVKEWEYVNFDVLEVTNIDLSAGLVPKQVAPEPTGRSANVGVTAAQSAPPRMYIPAIAKAANGAIVSIIMSDKDGNPIAQGSGFLISSDGVILTNYHVIAVGSSAVVKLPDGAVYVVDGVLAADKTRDVAVIKVHGSNFRTLTLGDSDQLQVGDEVVAIGNPLSLESTVSNGIVSGIRSVEEEGGKFLQVTTPISPGSSGGPLLNMAGEVVGITTMYLEGGENLNFAIPIDDAKRLLLDKSTTIQAMPNESEPIQAQALDAAKALNWISSHMLARTLHTMPGVNGTTVQMWETSSLSFEGCRVTIYDETIMFTVFKSGESLGGGTSTITWGPFDLSDLRPDEIFQAPDKDYQPPGAYLQIGAVSAIPVVQTTVPGPTTSFMRSGLHIWFDSADLVDRQVKAWHDAIVGCGGKPIPDVY
jgi:S1-C subfamily serine protease